MKKYKAINNQSLDAIRKDLEQLFTKYFNESGVSLKIGAITYDPTANSFSTKLNGQVVLDGLDPREQAFRTTLAKHSYMFKGIKESDYGRVFLFEGKPVKLVELSPKSRKYPYLGETENGTIYKYSKSVVEKSFGIEQI